MDSESLSGISIAAFQSGSSQIISLRPVLYQTFISQSATSSNSLLGNPDVEPIKPVDSEKHLQKRHYVSFIDVS